MKIESFVVNNDWILEGSYHADGGECNGYCILPKDHPCFGLDYDEIHDVYDVYAPGGLTYSKEGGGFNEKNWPDLDKKYHTSDYWIIGFDTLHYGDSREMWPRKRVEEEAAKLAFRMLEIWLLDERKKKSD